MSRISFDPQLLPVDSIAGEAPVPAERLCVDSLRRRFIDPPTWAPESAEAHLLRDGGVIVPASVLIPIVAHEQGATLLLTQRAPHLYDHAGQISFPGGRTEASDRDAIDTALRETREEIGLDPRHVEVLGTLPDYLTVSGFRVTPVVALAHPPFVLSADTFEVAEIFEVPLAHLMNGAHHQRRSFQSPGGETRRLFYAMPYDRFFIWGATAGMLRNLFHFLRA